MLTTADGEQVLDLLGDYSAGLFGRRPEMADAGRACAARSARSLWGGRVAGGVIGLELLGAVADRFGLLGAPGSPGVSWGDWAHFRVETAELVPWAGLVQPAAVAATVTELMTADVGALLVAGLWWRWVGKATAGLFVVYLIAMVPGMGPESVLRYAVPVLVGGALIASARGSRPSPGDPRARRDSVQTRRSRQGTARV